jgi:hypothetical protein
MKCGILCSPNEDFGSRNKRSVVSFRGPLQGREYSLWATNRCKCTNSLLLLLPKCSFGKHIFGPIATENQSKIRISSCIHPSQIVVWEGVKFTIFCDQRREYGLGTHIGPTMHQIFNTFCIWLRNRMFGALLAQFEYLTHTPFGGREIAQFCFGRF